MNMRLLVADDNADAANSLAAILRVQGFEVEVAHGGEQAIARAVAANPDVLILDLNMPSIDGFQVAKSLRANPRFERKHFVALSGHSDQGHMDGATKAHFDDYLVKPCQLDVLLKILSEVSSNLEQ
jgi:CheY-like chemotaxis protein